MSYREMVRDAGLDPDSDEGRQMAELIEEDDRRMAIRWQCRHCGAWLDDRDPYCRCDAEVEDE